VAVRDEELKTKLTSEAYHVLREKGTEAPFSGKYHDTKEKGMYKCAVCGAGLFKSDAKFDSGTGWPSFDNAIRGAVELREDDSHGMRRIEVACANCGSHLGHLFDDMSSSGKAPLRQDGKPATKRYCINSVCLSLEKENK